MNRLAHLIVALLLVAGCSKGGSSPTSPGGGGGTNHAPTVNVNTSATHLLNGGPSTATITATASDPDGDQLTFGYTATGGTIDVSGPTATTGIFTPTHWGPASVTVTASDGKGGTSSATASMYVRQTAQPSITIAAVGTQYCGSGTAHPSCFQIQMQAPETLIITGFTITPSGTPGGSACAQEWTYNDVALAAGQAYTFLFSGNAGVCAACTSCTGDPNQRWDVFVYGRRPEPDGGSFGWSTTYWTP